MHQVTRDKLNRSINQIRGRERALVAFEKASSGLSESQWHDARKERTERLNDSLEDFAIMTQVLMCRNSCKKVQSTINYYRVKAGISALKINAFI